MVALTFRPARERDAPYIRDFVMMAESGLHGGFSYARLFGLEETAAYELFELIAAEPMEACELCYPAFVIVEEAEKIVGGCAAWIEPEGGSNLPKAQLLSYYIGLEKFQAAKQAFQAIAQVAISRMPGALQLDEFGIYESMRGKGVLQALIAHTIEQARLMPVPPSKAQIILVDSNTRALKAYLKAGFTQVGSTFSDNPIIKHIFGGNGKILLEKDILLK